MCVCVCACVGVCFCEEERVEFGKGKREEEGREGGKKKEEEGFSKNSVIVGTLGKHSRVFHPREFICFLYRQVSKAEGFTLGNSAQFPLVRFLGI